MTKPFKWIEPSEKEIETAILQFLNFQIGCFAFKVNTMGVYDQRNGCYRKPSKFVVLGTPDILACYSVKGVGAFIGFEVKSLNGVQSKFQKEFQEKLQDRANGFYFLVRSVDDAEKALSSVKDQLGSKFS